MSVYEELGGRCEYQKNSSQQQQQQNVKAFFQTSADVLLGVLHIKKPGLKVPKRQRQRQRNRSKSIPLTKKTSALQESV